MNQQPEIHDRRVDGLLARLEGVIDIENEALGSDPDFDLKHSNALKSRCLYDMTMLFRDIGPGQLAAAQQRRLSGLRAKLDLNRVRVQAHMEAVSDLADMIKDTVAESEADGTYSEDQFRGYDLS